MIEVCYRCLKLLQEVAPIEDRTEVKKGICGDCLKLEPVQVQRALKKLMEAGTIERLRGRTEGQHCIDKVNADL